LFVIEDKNYVRFIHISSARITLKENGRICRPKNTLCLNLTKLTLEVYRIKILQLTLNANLWII